ncbi:MAG: type II toxin-antitoxin system VapC family toxin [Nitrospirota bacterium]
MPSILANTDVLIDYLAGIPFALEGFEEYGDRLQTTAISCFELLSGARAGKRGDRIRRLVAALHVLPLDRNAAERAAALRQNPEAAGSPIGMADSLIAGIALAQDPAVDTQSPALRAGSRPRFSELAGRVEG